MLAQPRGFGAGVIREIDIVEQAFGVIAALRRISPRLEVGVLPGIKETVQFRLPAELLPTRRVSERAA
jgi:hypothetical protein